MGWSRQDIDASRHETYSQKKKRIIAQEKDKLYSDALWENLQEEEKDIYLFILCALKSQFWIHCIFNAADINWYCYLLNIANRYYERNVMNEITIDTFDFQTDDGIFHFM